MRKKPTAARPCSGLLIVAIALVGSGSALAQDPAELFPERTIFYACYSGSELTTRAARGTAFGKICSDAHVKRFAKHIESLINVAIRKYVPDEPRAKLASIRDIVNKLLDRPTAFALIDVSPYEGKLDVKAALVCHAGNKATELSEDLHKLFTELSKDLQRSPWPMEDFSEKSISGIAVRSFGFNDMGEVVFGAIDDWLVICRGAETFEEIAKFAKGPKKGSLARSAALTTSRKKIGGKADRRIFSLVINLEAAAAKLTPVGSKLGPGVAMFAKFLDSALEEEKAKSTVVEMYYQSQGCLFGSYVLRSADSKSDAKDATDAITDDDLSKIPASTSWALAANVDLAEGYQNTMKLLDAFGPGIGSGIKMWLAGADKQLGFSLENDLLANLRDTFIIYDTPEHGGLWFGGTVLLAESAESEKVAECLGKLVRFGGKLAGAKMVTLKTSDYRHHKLTYVNFKGIPIPVAPAWTTHGGWLVFGLYPQTTMSALDRLTSNDARDTSILTNPQFVSARKIVGDLGSGVSYVDTRSAIDSAYAFMLPLFHVAAGMLREEGIAVDGMAFPPLESFSKHLFGDIRTTRTDSQGELSLSYGPLPISSEPFAISGLVPIATMTSILLPSLSRARELSKRTVCAANMRGIGSAMYIHAEDHNTFGSEFETHIKENNAIPEMFVCPSTDCEAGNLYCSYEYIAGQSLNSEPTNVLVYEKRDNHREGGNVLFVDGHVAFIKPYNEVERLVEETKERLKKAKGDNASDDDSKNEQGNDAEESKDE
jgi:prepilin-type processing-associated H-X9-DG protein